MNGKIMLVDDSSYMRGVLKRILRSQGIDDVLEAADGAAAVETYARERPDVVLMDIVMPEKNGLDALRDIRDLDGDAQVIMVTAIGQDVIVQEAMEAGAKGFIVKPFDASQVRDEVERALRRDDA